MGFLNNLVSEFTHSGQQGQQQHGSSQGGNNPPPVSPPWFAEWDARDNRWLFVNQQTGERTFTYPGPGYGQQQGGYGGNQGGYNQNAYNPSQGNYQQEEHKKEGGNGWKYAAAGAAGLAGGALLMHEGEEMKEGWDRDKYRLENDVSNFPENAAGWTGEQVGRAEGFGDRVENRWDNAVDDVEDFPENAANWTGQKVQEVEDIPQDVENRWDNAVDNVEDFGDRMDNAYDDGRDERRYDDDRRDGDY
ncbi:hypothetical protein BKA66DRAFT_438006 [Pyrenochaeta sp. MPI-SDFR-AT-0127]|nr:hypothetical protein BKA66DRAFT_438006 [Pyrenochaeta sp. MPI-SDFR-AT-0127]